MLMSSVSPTAYDLKHGRSLKLQLMGLAKPAGQQASDSLFLIPQDWEYGQRMSYLGFWFWWL